MKKLFLGLFGILTLILGLTPTSTFASANDFYFTDFTADYYLNKNEAGSGTMRIEEQLTAVFPDTNQNHGIERCIPKKYNGTSILVNPSFVVQRNGQTEPFSTYSDGKYLCLRIGSASSYVHGEQTYTINYNVENVILQPTDSEYQELYWDANGTGWSQKFQALTARVHLPENLDAARKTKLDSDLSCYVGAYGTRGTAATSRCTVSSAPDTNSDYATTFTFTAENLRPGEGLTFDLEFMPKTFSIKNPDPNYALYIFIAIFVALSVLIIVHYVKEWRKVEEKKALAKEKVVPVQYVPPKNLTVAEAGTAWLKSPKSLQVASLMQLAVTHKIELEKGEKKTFGGYHWKIHIKNLDDVSQEQAIVLEILNGGSSVKVGDVIEVKRHSSTSHLEKLGRDFSKKIDSSLRNKHLFEPETAHAKIKTSSKTVVAIVVFIVFCFVGLPLVIGIAESVVKDILNDDGGFVFLLGTIAFFIHITTVCILSTRISKYKKRTLDGIRTSKYLDGLKEYMNLAEKDRLKFLQSVKGADTSHNGIARLYEKLLPYAVIFGIEDSWMDELNKYYQMNDIDNPYWLRGATYFPISDFRSFTSYTSSSIYSSTASSDSGGSSGGGGGGFSGGGGGGGGGGGW